MKRILAIGGIDDQAYLTKFEKEMIKQTGKKHPQILFVPTAGNDDLKNYELSKNRFKTLHGCHTEPLLLIKESPTIDEVRKKVLAADLVFIGGGSVLKLITRFKQFEMDKIIIEAQDRGVYFAGMSAGAICFGKDYLDVHDIDHPQIIAGLNHVPLTLCPHYDKESFQHYVKAFEARTYKKSLVGIGIDNNCALEIIGEKYRVIASKDSSNAYMIYRVGHQLVKTIIEKKSNLSELNELYNIV